MKIVTTILALTVSVIAIGGAGAIYLDYLNAKSFERIRQTCAPGVVISFSRESAWGETIVNCDYPAQPDS